MKIEIWSDYACPFCYIGKRNLEQAIENIDFKDNIVIRHKSYELNPNSDYTREKTYYEVLVEKYDLSLKKVEQINENITNQAARVGLVYNFDTLKPTTTFDAHRVTQLATKEGKGDEMAERLFRAFFTEGQLISDERSEEHTSELQSRGHLVCRLLLEKKHVTIKSVRWITIVHPLVDRNFAALENPKADPPLRHNRDSSRTYNLTIRHGYTPRRAQSPT